MKRKFAVFDIDGTLIRWQLYHAVVDRLAKNNLLGPDARTVLREARMHWKRREHDDAFKDYELALIHLYEKALPTLTTDQFDTAVQDIASEYQAQAYTYTRDLIKHLKSESYVILAISGSHQEIVEQIGKLYDFDDVIGTEYVREDGHFTGQKIFAARDKRQALQKLIDIHSLTLKGSIAVGDSGSDIPMLAMVEQPITFNPDKILYEEAKKNGWKIVVERKNVIYTLKASPTGNYKLQ